MTSPLRALAATRAAIAKAAEAGAAWSALGLLVICDPAAPVVPSPEGAPFPEPVTLTPDGAAALAEDLAAIDGPRLLTNVPRDARGQLALGVDVALASYASSYDDPTIPSRRSRAWLVARTPERRRDPQVVTLTLDLCVGGDRRHRWNETRWLWDGRVVADETTRWGVTGLDPAGLRLEGRAGRIAALRERLASAGEAVQEADRAALCILASKTKGTFRRRWTCTGSPSTSDCSRFSGVIRRGRCPPITRRIGRPRSGRRSARSRRGAARGCCAPRRRVLSRVPR
ncbi:MAG: hypothetical protein U0232_07765 [Thermomicrobiales bacterium]